MSHVLTTEATEYPLRYLRISLTPGLPRAYGVEVLVGS
jgi:hypothetical protein